MGILDLLNGGTAFYEVKTQCENCNLKQQTKITKGKIAVDVIENGKCENCGCKKLGIIEK